MSRFRIQPHGRLQEWVAEEQGYFRDEGLDYEFQPGHAYVAGQSWSASVQSAETAVPEIRDGAFEDYERGRACEISSACHWTVNMASSSELGRMWGHAYSVTPSGIYVPPESAIKKSADLAGVQIGVGYHSGSHFSALQALEKVLPRESIALTFIGRPLDRLDALLDRRVEAANVFGAPHYILEAQGFRKVVDTSFMIGFLFSDDADTDDVERYFRAVQRAQRDIDLEPERYKHYFLKELPEKFHGLCEVANFGLGERMVFEPYTREAFERSQRWMRSWELFPEGQGAAAVFETAVRV